jgi:Holliday junction resolvase RusA-like endonuclease
MISLTIPGSPQGKQRPRWFKFGTYTPKETVNYETLIKELFAVKYADFKPIDCPVKMALEIFHSIPNSKSKKVKALMEAGSIRPAVRPDMDNVIKILCDALSGLAYQNDSQIIELTAKKFYSYIPRVELTLDGCGEEKEG